MPVLDTDRLIVNRIDAIRAYHDECRIDRAEIDVSGGVDSAVVLGLLVHALGPDRVTAVYQGIDSSLDSLGRAREVAAKFNVPLIELDLTGVYRQIVSIAQHAVHAAYAKPDSITLSVLENRRLGDPTIDGSLRSCLRAPVGRYMNRLMGNGIRHGTGNECEDRWLRFYQKGGDGEVDTNPIAMLSKGEVYQIARALGVPRSILTALPSPDLWGNGEGHSDEAELLDMTGVSFTYSRVDPDTGEYTQVGLIEKVNRALDLRTTLSIGAIRNAKVEDLLFCDVHTNEDWILHEIRQHADDPLAGLDGNFAQHMLHTVRSVERVTRHKANPNIPTLGVRWQLVEAGILTNDLPSL